MISDEKAREIIDKTFNFDECVSRTKEVTDKKVYFEISDFLFSFLDKIGHSYVYGSFTGCIILSGVSVEIALTEELAKHGYPRRCLESFNFSQLIESGKEEGVISEDTAKTAHELRKLRNKYVHPTIKRVYDRVESRAEDILQSIKYDEEEKSDALNAFKKAEKILPKIYSEQRYPPKIL